MKKVLILSSIVILAIAILAFYFKSNLATNNVAVVNPQTNEHVEVARPLANDSVAERNSAQNDLQIFRPISSAEIKNHRMPELFKNPEKGFLFAFDDDVLASKKVGDHLQMQMLVFGINRQATITSVEKLEDDITRWSGTFDGYPADINHFTITQTQKDRYAIMKLMTDRGEYVAEIKDGIGLAKSTATDFGDDGLHVGHEH